MRENKLYSRIFPFISESLGFRLLLICHLCDSVVMYIASVEAEENGKIEYRI